MEKLPIIPSEEILRQTFEYAEIIPHKNYNFIEDKPLKHNGEYHPTHYVHEEQISLRSVKKKHKYYFHSGTEHEHVSIVLPVANRKHKRFVTVNYKTIKKHFGDQFSTITCYSSGRTIKKTGDKINVCYWTSSKFRHVNTRYFKKQFSVNGFSFNIKNGNFYTYTQQSTRKKVRCNNFNDLRRVINIIVGYREFPNKMVTESYESKFDDVSFIRSLYDTLNFNSKYPYEDIVECIMNDKTGSDYELLPDVISLVMKKFVEIKKMKVPNNYEYLLTNFYPTEKYLKKNKRKLIASVLDKMGIKCDFMVKKLHLNDKLDLTPVLMLKSLFGNSYLKHLPNLSSQIFTEKIHGYGSINGLMNMVRGGNFKLTDNEKSNMIKIINDFIYNEKSSRAITNVFYDFYDHFDMSNKIKDYELDVKPLSSITYNNWLVEHSELSKQFRLVKKGYTIQYIFDEETINEVETPIIINDVKYQPIILKKEIEYLEEGNHMHHCVGSYVEHETSVIISLRKDGGKERVTSEFEYKNGKCKQSRYFSNQQPPEDFKIPLKLLYEKVLYLSFSNKLKFLEKQVVPINKENLEQFQIITEDLFFPF